MSVVWFIYQAALANDTPPPQSLTSCLLAASRPMVSEPINSSLFHQLAEQLQQQNLEQFQKQLLEHQQKVVAHKSVSSKDSAYQ